jgi:mRNA deadenylase 3'-5' endonuclease subunit Ccr4
VDIVCLQEVDHYEDFYKPQLEELGYEVVFEQKTGKPDGEIIAFKKDKFQLLDRKHVVKMDLQHKYQDNEEFKKGGIALFAKIQSLTKPSVVLNIVNTHLFWDPKCEHVRFLQAGLIYRTISKHFNSDEKIVMCGDFNCGPNSNSVRFLLNKTKPDPALLAAKSEKNLEVMNEIYEDEAVKEFCMKFNWRSAYEKYGELIGNEDPRHPQYTHYLETFKENIDYIFYTNNGLFVKELKGLPTKEEIHDLTLPNKVYPSDHLPLMATFRYE